VMGRHAGLHAGLRGTAVCSSGRQARCGFRSDVLPVRVRLADAQEARGGKDAPTARFQGSHEGDPFELVEGEGFGRGERPGECRMARFDPSIGAFGKPERVECPSRTVGRAISACEDRCRDHGAPHHRSEESAKFGVAFELRNPG